MFKLARSHACAQRPRGAARGPSKRSWGASLLPGLQARPRPRAAEIRALFDVPVVVALAAAHELAHTRLPAEVEDDIRQLATPLRQRTFAMGRLAAARATAGLLGAPCRVGVDRRGAPLWPTGISGSLSHTSDIAVCAVARRAEISLGIDIEPLASAQSFTQATRHIATPLETEQLAACSDQATAILQLFCAKEALYKALPADLQHGWRFTSTTLRWRQPDYPSSFGVLDVAQGPIAGAVAKVSVIGSHMVAVVTR